MQQYFVIEKDGKFYLSDEDLHHLRTVLRAQNKKILCINDKDAYLCCFTSDSNSYNIEIIEKVDRNSEIGKDILLYQALIRNENFDLVLQKATELGATSIIPTVFERNVVKIDKEKESKKLERFSTIVKNASQQCNRTIVPTVDAPMKVTNIKLEDGEIGLVCYEKDENTKSLVEIKDKILSSSSIKIVIGPEGGITRNEYDSLIGNGFYSVSLGKRILRSETASFNILSILSYIIEMEG